MATALACIEPPTRQSGSLADQALESVSEAIVVVDIGPLDLPVVLANAAARRILGNALREHSLYDFLGPSSSAALEALLTELAQRARPLRRLIAWRTTTGERSFDTSCQRLGGASGQPLVLLRFTHDPAPPELRFALDCLPMALLLLDPHLKISYANPAARRLNGADSAELVGASALSVRPTAALPLDVYRRALGGAAGFIGSAEWRDPDSPGRVFDLRLQPVQGAGGVIGLLMIATPRDDQPRGVIAADGDLMAWREQEQLAIARRERRRLGRDLHDGLGQELTGVALLLRGLARQLETHAPQLQGPTDEIIALVNRAIEGTRSLARGLLSVANEPGGLLAALRGLADRARALHGLDVQCRSEITPPLWLDENTANHLYRIAQEALTNAIRHAQAGRVEILLRVAAGGYLLEIADDGIGLSAAASDASGLGLGILRERAVQLGAHLDFMDNSPRGTRVRVIGTLQRRDGEVWTNVWSTG